MRSNQEKKLNCRRPNRIWNLESGIWNAIKENSKTIPWAILRIKKLFLARGGFLFLIRRKPGVFLWGFTPKRAGQKILILLIIFSWIFAGWPQISGFPPGIQVARADQTTARSPTISQSNSGWINPDNMHSQTSGDATGSKNSTVEQVTFGFDNEIAAGDTSIDGVTVEIDAFKTGIDNNTLDVNLVGVGTCTGKNSGVLTTTVDDIYNVSLGGTTDTWSCTALTVANVRSTGFGVSIAPNKGSGPWPVNDSWLVDHIRVTVDYTPAAGSITADIVNASYVSVGSPTMAMNTASFDFACQTITGSFGTASEQIYVDNDNGANNGWTLTLAAQAVTDVWDSAGTDYDFNDPTDSGCTDGADSPDTLGGQMTVDPSVVTLAVGQCGSCTTGNISLGSSASFDEGTTDTITLLDALAASDDVGDWTLQGVSISQKIPAEQPAASDYSINMVLTVAAN